jgi:hypothetical protein
LRQGKEDENKEDKAASLETCGFHFHKTTVQQSQTLDVPAENYYR